MLQQPEVGGEFEFAPMLRGPNGEENYDKAGIQEAGALRICSLFMNRLVVSNMFYFPEYMGLSFPLTFIFFKMVKTTNQIWFYIRFLYIYIWFHI
jgi:hypothetical protein